MIRVTCPSCGSKINAHDDLAGQTRKCPKCATPLKIVADAAAPESGETLPLDEADPTQHVHFVNDEALPKPDFPERLNRESHYLVCDKTHLVAVWENNGQGWLLHSSNGMLNAKRNRDSIPAEGDFRLVELKFAVTPEGKRLTGLLSYQIAARWALNTLADGDDQIMGKITSFGPLNRDQKNVIRQALREQFMRPVWEHAANVLEYLANADFHSHGVG